MPEWINTGFQEYARRLPSDFQLQLIELPLGFRGKGADLQRAIAKEGEQMLAAIGRTEHVIALDVKGQDWSTEAFSEQARQWQMNGCDVSLLVGGPDGLAEACLVRAQQHWSLSSLTLPHSLVRVLLAEQIYRAWSMLAHHPYHK
jgi:23S rRNA (pseudouridine1915-N3)-methyltransferase